MAVAWREFGSYILPDLPQCPRGVAANAAREAAIEFCVATQLCLMRSEPSPIVAGHALYTPDTPDGVVVSSIIKAQIIKRDSDGNNIGVKEIFPVNDLDLGRMGNWEEQKGEARCFRVFEPNRIQLIPAPEVTVPDSLVLEIAVKPSRDAKLCPQFLLDSYGEAIGYGAKRKLAAIPNKTWSNPAMVQFYNSEFRRLINDFRRAQNRAHSRKGLRVRMINT